MIRHNMPGIEDDACKQRIRSMIRKGQISLGGNRKLKIYGTLRCSSGKKMLPVNRVFFSSEIAAIQAGYRPCGHCKTSAYRQWKATQHDNTI